MNCEQVARENVAERYVSGKLDPETKELYERHYFGCDACARNLETWLAIEKPLRAMASARPGPSWIRGAAAIAAGVVVLIGVSLLPHPESPVSGPGASQGIELAELAHLDPPVYSAPAFRGAENTAETLFREAMDAYLRHDYARAIAGLRASLELDPVAAAPRFFLGASELLSGQIASGVHELEQVAASKSPFAEEAGFDLAKGYLMMGRREDALAILRHLESQGGDFAAQARALTDRIAGAAR
jgi:hypothetical protein